MDVLSISQEEKLGEIIEDDPNTVVIETVTEAVLVAVVHPFADPNQRLGLGILSLVLQMRRSFPRLAGNQLLQLAVQIAKIVIHGSRGRLGALLPGHGPLAASSLVIDLHQWSSSRDQTLVGLRVESWSHGEAGNWESWRKISHGHKVILENFCHGWPLVGFVPEQLLDQVLGERSNSAGDVILVLLDSAVGIFQGLGFKGGFANKKRVQDAAQGPDINLIAVT